MIGIAVCAGWQYRFEATPGAQPLSVLNWPENSTIPRRPGRCTAVMVLHPRCPCSRASVIQLEEFVQRTRQSTDIVVIAPVPPNAGPEWTKTGALRDAQRIPELSLVLDPGGAQAAAFGLSTSGHVVLFDPGGDLLFSGGITPSRGQTGPNRGLEALVAGVSNIDPKRAVRCSVFGCPVVAPGERSR